VSPLPLLKLAQALARLKPFPVAGMAHRSYSGLPETFSPPFSILCPWIHGLFPAIEFAVAFSLSLSLCPTPVTPPPWRGTTPPAVVCSPGLIPSVRFRSHGSDHGSRFPHTRLTPWPACQRPSPLALGPLGQRALPLVR
jgi:hypothetical protein